MRGAGHGVRSAGRGARNSPTRRSKGSSPRRWPPKRHPPARKPRRRPARSSGGARRCARGAKRRGSPRGPSRSCTRSRSPAAWASHFSLAGIVIAAVRGSFDWLKDAAALVASFAAPLAAIRFQRPLDHAFADRHVRLPRHRVHRGGLRTRRRIAADSSATAITVRWPHTAVTRDFHWTFSRLSEASQLRQARRILRRLHALDSGSADGRPRPGLRHRAP